MFLSVAIFVLYLFHGGTVGLSDDEAYYWVLSRHPALGYAYHPPAVAWLIGLSQKILGPVFGQAHPVVVRFPAAACAAAVLWIAAEWLRSAGARREYAWAAGALVFALPGFGAMAWMTVPDLPLLLGWMLAFWGTWRVVSEDRPGAWAVGLGVCLAGLSKYSGVLVALSSAYCLWAWEPWSKAGENRRRALGALILGGVLALAPVLEWNARHHWVSILYQIHDRHAGASWSFVRWGRFVLSQLIVAGPAVLVYFWILGRRVVTRKERGVSRYAVIWAAPPAAVYLLQPFWADFKAHWPLVVWIPVVLDLAHRAALDLVTVGERRLVRLHLAWGLTVTMLVILACRFPVLAPWIRDPHQDPTNDLYGWSESLKGLSLADVPIVGGRYQTAAQVAAAVAQLGGNPDRVTLIPKTYRDWDEWPHIEGVDAPQPASVIWEWPTLTTPVFFVSDNQHPGGPGFLGADCHILQKNDVRRWSYAAKEIVVWSCQPIQSL
ncbi:MAG TPA: glycosyltransferase family 39 protein [Bdellovibrionota bacterium]|jgi:4-amino-4-deoxy-L-arabinose transferase-like glycosyltransferase|nr:glycosyltransferase family 39 protein [Bdellovibrionota bacterium]